RRQRQRVHRDADAVHRFAPAVEIPVRGLQRRRARLLEDDRGALRIRAVDARLGRGALTRDEIQIALGEKVRVYVDRVRPGHGRDCTIEPTSTRRARRAYEKERPVRLPHERFDYSAIVDRKPWRLPKGARIAVWTI